MKEVGRGSGGAESGSNFAGDEAGFSHAGEDDAVGGDDLQNQVDGGVEGGEHGAVKTVCEGGEGGGFDADVAGCARRCNRGWHEQSNASRGVGAIGCNALEASSV